MYYDASRIGSHVHAGLRTSRQIGVVRRSRSFTVFYDASRIGSHVHVGRRTSRQFGAVGRFAPFSPMI